MEIKTIQELSDVVYNNMGDYSQLVIHFVQDVETLILTEEKETLYDIFQIQYDIQLVMDVIDKSLKKDVEALSFLYDILSEEAKQIKYN